MGGTGIGTSKRSRAFTLLEVAVVIALLGTFITGVASSLNFIQRAFQNSVRRSELSAVAQHAMQRIVDSASNALSLDSDLELILDNGSSAFNGVRFRIIESITSGVPTYDDTLKYFIVGPDTSEVDVGGVVVGRAASLKELYKSGCGSDSTLGTDDDDTAAVSTSSVAISHEVLVSDRFAPITGNALTIEFDSGSDDKMLVFTLRMNAKDRNGTYLLAQDLVIVERLALR